MRPSNATILVKETILQSIGALLLFIALFGFAISFVLKHHSITTYDTIPPTTTYSYGTGSLEYLQSENPDAVVKRLDDGFPVKSTLIMIFGLIFISRKHRSRTQDETTVRLLEALKNNPKVKLVKLSNALGIDEQEIISKLPSLNQYHGVNYTFNYHSNMIVDNELTIAWKLSSKCENCGGTSAEQIIVAIETDSLNCPYCDSKIHDAEFEYQREKALARMQRKNNKLGFLPFNIHKQFLSN